MPDTARQQRSIFNVDRWTQHERDRAAYHDVLRTFSLMEPRELYAMLYEMRLREARRYAGESIDRLRARIRTSLELAPLVRETMDLDDVAERNARFFATRSVDFVYLSVYSGDPLRMLQLIEFHDMRQLVASAKTGPTVVAGLHYGPTEEVGVGVMAQLGRGVTVIVSGVRNRPGPSYVEGLRDRIGPVNVEFVYSKSRSALLLCLKAIERGRIIMVFPEFVFMSEGSRGEVVDFLGTKVSAPRGLDLLVERTNARVFPLHVQRLESGRYRCVSGGQLTTGPSIMQAVFSASHDVMRSRAAEWELWPMWREMVVTANAARN